MDQSTDITKVQLGEPMSLLVILGGMWMRCRNNSKTTAKPTPEWVTAHKSREPGAHFTACRQFSSLESFLSRCLSWSELLPGSSPSESIFYPAGLVSVYRLVCLKMVSALFIAYWGGVNLVCFRDFLKLFWVVYFWFKDPPRDMECFNPGGSC